MTYPKDADSDTASRAETQAPSSWPRRRNPLPANFLHTTPPPRRHRTNDSGTFDMKPNSLADAYSSDPWDGDTITLHSFGPLSRSSSSTGGADEPVFSSVHDKQLKRTISGLSRQLEGRDDDVAVLTCQIDQAKKQTEEARRQMQAERQECKKYELQIRWHEGQLRQQQAKMDSMSTQHRLALSLAQRKNDNLVERLAAKIVHAENDVKRLKQREAELSKELDDARKRDEKSSGINTDLLRQLSDARHAASQATDAAATLMERLDERASFIAGLEDHILRQPHIGCMSLDTRPLQASSPVALLSPVVSPGVSGKCLFAEIAKATLMQHDGRNNNDGCNGALPAPPLFPTSDAAGQKRPDKKTAIQPGSSAAAAAAGTEGMLHWFAVYVHLLWSLYYTVCITPVLYLAGIVFRAAFLFAMPGPLVRALAILLPSAGLSVVRKKKPQRQVTW
ncbi:hypothetical protein LPJ81_005811 [Coemansia sp. IMI 209127]|nr:hypothetical protein LPJ81_005811 [Coemansia sp. IMI 209127]